MRLIILPLTQPDKQKKQDTIESAVTLAKQIKDEQQQLSSIAGIVVASNKFIEANYFKELNEW